MGPALEPVTCVAGVSGRIVKGRSRPEVAGLLWFIGCLLAPLLLEGWLSGFLGMLLFLIGKPGVFLDLC